MHMCRSEEDNDPLTDDGASSVSVPVLRAATLSSNLRTSHPKGSSVSRVKHQLASSLLSDSDGVDSPTYDGDVESSATAGPDVHSSRAPHQHHHHHTSSTSTLNTPITPNHQPSSTTPSTELGSPMPPPRATTVSNHPVFISSPIQATHVPLLVPEEPAVAAASEAAFNPAALTADDIQAFVQKAIDGETWRKYKINPPPTDRPVSTISSTLGNPAFAARPLPAYMPPARHALQLRQAKLSFPSVYLLVGVNSDELVRAHKAQGIMTHAERLEAARHCRWVDEIVAEAPWVIDEEFIQKYQIDYVAHDEDPYASGDHADVYGYAKSQGKFIPTRRTPGVSTSELLERIVSGYRKRDFDEKLTKMGHAELRAEGSDYDDSSRMASRLASRSTSPTHKPVAMYQTAMMGYFEDVMGHYGHDYDEESNSSDASESEQNSEDDFVDTPRPTVGSKRKRGTTNRKSPRKPKTPPKPLYTAKVIETATGTPSGSEEDASKVDRADSNVLARIRKAMKLATHPGTGEAEAKVAMRMATRLMAQQNITQADLIANETAEERSTRAGNSRVRLTSTAGKMVKNQRWHSNATAAANEAFDVQLYTESPHQNRYLDLVFYGLADNTVAAALAFEMLYNQIEVWVAEKKGELKGRAAANSYRMGVSGRVLQDAKRANRQALIQAEEDEKKRIMEEAAAEEAARTTELARLAAGKEDIPEPKVKVEEVPDEEYKCIQPLGEPIVDVPVTSYAYADDDSDDDGPSMDYGDPDANEPDDDLRADFEDNDDTHDDFDLDALEQKINVKDLSLDTPKRRKPTVPTLPEPALPKIALPATTVEPHITTKEPIVKIKPEPADDTPSWTSALQLRTFRDNAKTIAETYIKEQGMKLRKGPKLGRNNKINSAAYDKGWDDGQKVDLKRRRIEGQHDAEKEGESQLMNSDGAEGIQSTQ
ncbi:hypothetical protein DXG01_004565 [Tephrocybe rancida]|nr:hypothetical protein DXG01_004565 [Tephrocybe rancida]